MHEITCPGGHRIARAKHPLERFTPINEQLFTDYSPGQPRMLNGSLIPNAPQGSVIMPINRAAHCAVCGELWIRSTMTMATSVGKTTLHKNLNQILINGRWHPEALKAGTREVVEDDLLPV